MNFKRIQVISSAVVLFAILLSCKSNGSNANQTASTTETKIIPFIEVVSPKENEVIAEGKSVTLQYSLPTEATSSDSVVILLNNNKLYSGCPDLLNIPTEGLPMGTQRIVLAAYKSGDKVAEKHLSISIKSATKPTLYSYKVVNTYAHDNQAYTQGLTIDNNLLYEGTGQRGISDLRIVDLSTGQVEKSLPLPNYIFGEGIAVLNDKIYQLSWQEQRGFIYDKNKFEKIGEFVYPGEGWGITTDGNMLFMSDGTKSIRIIDPNTLAEKSRIEVYDNMSAVEYINELEFINGEIWANLYLTDKVARIDPSSGKVLGYIDFKNLLPSKDRTENTDVLNGIAYNSKTGQIFVTGKNWPKLFEIKIIKK